MASSTSLAERQRIRAVRSIVESQILKSETGVLIRLRALSGFSPGALDGMSALTMALPSSFFVFEC